VDVSGVQLSRLPFFEEFNDVEINTRIHKVLAHGVDLYPGAGPTRLREGVDFTRVSLLGPVLGCLCEFQFVIVLMSMRGVSRVLTMCHRGRGYLA
jgi:hypothetical protein